MGVEEGTEGSGAVKKSKRVESDSDSDSMAHSSTSSKKTTQSDGKSSKSGTPRRTRATESDSSPRPPNRRSSRVKRTSSIGANGKASDGNGSSNKSKGSRDFSSLTDKEEDSSPPLTTVPRYVDYDLLPGTTLTIHRKEFVTAELNYTAQAMATKLASKVSRAIKKGTYTPRSQLPPSSAPQRPIPLTPAPTPLPDPLHAIALDLKQNRRVPPRPAMMQS